MQSPHITIGVVLNLLLIILDVVSLASTYLLADALVNDITARDGCSSIVQHPLISSSCIHNRNVGHIKRLVRAHQRQYRFIDLCIMVINLYATLPVILCNLRIAFHDVAVGIDTSELLEGEQSL